MSKNTFNSTRIDTMLGSCEGDPFSPPADFVGGEDEYFQLMRKRFNENPHCQRMQVIALYYHHPEALYPKKIVGPFEFVAWNVISKLRYSQPTINNAA